MPYVLNRNVWYCTRDRALPLVLLHDILHTCLPWYSSFFLYPSRYPYVTVVQHKVQRQHYLSFSITYSHVALHSQETQQSEVYTHLALTSTASRSAHAVAHLHVLFCIFVLCLRAALYADLGADNQDNLDSLRSPSSHIALSTLRAMVKIFGDVTLPFVSLLFR